MSTNDGGPAFPVAADVNPDGRSSGMSLRDYFAASHPHPFPNAESWEVEAKARYAYADAMLKAREVKS